MKNLDYKIVSIVLVGILIITYAWHWQDIFGHRAGLDTMESSMSTKGAKGMQHTMPDGSVMDMGMMNTQAPPNMDMGSMSMNDMAAMLKNKTGKALEKEFLVGMIPHHQGAVSMAKTVLADKTTSPEIRVFAENIIKAQDAEIAQMKKWLLEYK